MRVFFSEWILHYWQKARRSGSQVLFISLLQKGGYTPYDMMLMSLTVVWLGNNGLSNICFIHISVDTVQWEKENDSVIVFLLLVTFS